MFFWILLVKCLPVNTGYWTHWPMWCLQSYVLVFLAKRGAAALAYATVPLVYKAKFDTTKLQSHSFVAINFHIVNLQNSEISSCIPKYENAAHIIIYVTFSTPSAHPSMCVTIYMCVTVCVFQILSNLYSSTAVQELSLETLLNMCTSSFYPCGVNM